MSPHGVPDQDAVERLIAQLPPDLCNWLGVPIVPTEVRRALAELAKCPRGTELRDDGEWWQPVVLALLRRGLDLSPWLEGESPAVAAERELRGMPPADNRAHVPPAAAQARPVTSAPKAKRTRGQAVVVPLPERRELRPQHLDHLHTSGLTAETIVLAQLYTEDRSVVLGEILGRPYSRHCGSVIAFPFYLPGETEPHAYRIRPDRPRIRKRNGKERPVKYDQAESHGVLVYYAPRARAGGWLRDVVRLLYFCEGEKKCLLLDQLGLACVGLTGVWLWKDPNADGDQLVARILNHVSVAGRGCVICFDADSLKNDNTMLAARRLAGVLIALGAAYVLFVCPPLGADGASAPKGIDDYFAAYGEEATRALLATAAKIEAADPKQPHQHLRKIKALKDAPLDERLMLPDAYNIEPNGSLWVVAQSEKQGDSRIAQRGMFITRKLVDAYTHEVRYDLMYVASDGETWQTRSVSSRAVTDARTLLGELGLYAAPITNNSAGKLVDWFDAYVHVNAKVLGEIKSFSASGWHDLDGEQFFVTDRPIGKEDSTTQIAIDDRGDRAKLLKALTPRGEFDAHVAALRQAFDADPICAAAICASLAAPLLKPFNRDNFGMHLPGESSRGKTSMLKIAASIYGDPKSSLWVANWNVTAVGAELRAAMLCDLPLCYDEVGGVEKVLVERLVYSLINGGGRTRGKRDLSLRETLSWRTILLSTGEHELGDETSQTGVQVRIVQLRVSGFGKLTGTQIDELREACEANAGRVGEAWLEMLVEVVSNAETLPKHQAALRAASAELRAETKDQLQGRVAGYFATLMLAESFAAEHFGIGKFGGVTMLDLFRSLAREPIVDVGERGLELVQNWVLSDPDAFPELEMSPSGGLAEPRATGRATKVRSGFRRPDGAVLFIPSALRRFCREHELSHRQLLNGWKRGGFLSHNPGRLDLSIQIGATVSRLYALKPIASTNAEGETP
jgi:hypothetical protein